MEKFLIITYYNDIDTDDLQLVDAPQKFCEFCGSSFDWQKTVMAHEPASDSQKPKKNMKERFLIARNMKEMGVPFEHISMATGLSIPEVEKA